MKKMMQLLFLGVSLISSVEAQDWSHPFCSVNFSTNMTIHVASLGSIDPTGESISLENSDQSAYYFSQRDNSAAVFIGGAQSGGTLNIYRTYSYADKSSQGIVDSVSLATIVKYELIFLRTHGVITVDDVWIDHVASSMLATASLMGKADIDGVVFSADQDIAEAIVGSADDSFISHLPNQKNMTTANVSINVNANHYLSVEQRFDGGFWLHGLNERQPEFSIHDARGVNIPYQQKGEHIEPQAIVSGPMFLLIRAGADKGRVFRINK